jgi:hypothetical protein
MLGRTLVIIVYLIVHAKWNTLETIIFEQVTHQVIADEPGWQKTLSDNQISQILAKIRSW